VHLDAELVRSVCAAVAAAAAGAVPDDARTVMARRAIRRRESGGDPPRSSHGGALRQTPRREKMDVDLGYAGTQEGILVRTSHDYRTA